LTSPQRRVDFYILAGEGPTSRLEFACRLSEKAYRANTHVYAHASSAKQADELDHLLWTFRAGSFVPHERVNRAQPMRSPIGIGTPEVYSKTGEMLINLCEVIPTFSGGYSRIAEIVPADDAARAAGRKRFAQYRKLGLAPATHTIE
jgi:DNA polymerase-3 subunit chi